MVTGQGKASRGCTERGSPAVELQEEEAEVCLDRFDYQGPFLSMGEVEESTALDLLDGM